MGFGDSLLAAGAAERVYLENPKLGPVAILNGDNKPRWHPVWEGNPAVFCPVTLLHEHVRRIEFGGKNLPYYRPNHTEGFNGSMNRTWKARDHRPSFYLTEAEKARAQRVIDSIGAFILIEPTGLDRKNRNRCWPHDRWQKLANELKALPYTVAQLSRELADPLDGTVKIHHTSFRDACAVLSASQCAVLPEGGLAHGAGALRHPAVVLWGGNSDAEVMAYPDHVNLVDDDPKTPCGSLFPCDHCWEAWLRLEPAHVVAAVRTALGRP